jgi:prepilin-type N-terminal cleavage/methylation domain-containing protein
MKLLSSATVNESKGFTLIEIAVVLLIVGILIGALMVRSTSVIGGAKTTEAMALIKDLTVAINAFRDRYHYLPGDMPKAGDDIPGTSAACNIALNTVSIGNGQIDTAAEVACVAEHLVRAGFIKGSTAGIFSRGNSSSIPDVFFTARRTVGTLPPTVFPPSVLNEIILINQPCETAQGIDSRMDDGNFATGRITASVVSCTSGSSNDPVPIIDIAF